MRQPCRQNKAYTLVEILIAVSLFAVVGMISLSIFINVTRIQAQLALENAIYEDARFMMERLSRAIRNNAIDYEEYFNKAVDSNNLYGKLFGCYAGQFYNPGTTKPLDLTVTLGYLGAYCNNATLYTGQACVVYKPSIDLNTGMYPYYGAPVDAALSNAFCPAYLYGKACVPENDNLAHQLYLISPDGKRKTYFALKKVNLAPVEHALAMVEKVGEDSNNDGITETWNDCASGANPLCCKDRYDCAGWAPLTLEQSLKTGAAADIYKGFIPISPLRTTVTRLDFRITPGEDPRKAFSEPNSVTQPRVVITLEVKPNAQQLTAIGDVDGNLVPSIVLQTTVSSRIQSEVKSYLGADTHGLIGSGGLRCKLSGDP